MDIAIVGRHTKVNDDMRGRIATKMEKLSELAPLATRAEVHVVHERNPKLSTDAERVEITLHGRAVVRAEASAEDRVAALELATARIVEQLRKLHERRAHRHQGKADMATFAMADMTAAQAAATVSEVESVEAWDGAASVVRARDPARRHAHRDPFQGALRRTHDRLGRDRPDGTRGSRLLPVPRLGLRHAKRRVPQARLDLRSDPARSPRKRG